MAEASMSGPMVADTTETGRTTTCTGQACTHGRTEGVTRASTLTTESTDTAYTSGKMAANMRDVGRTVSSMERVCTSRPTDRNVAASGKMERESNGLMSSETDF
jgi:hypothetical protein